MAEGIVQTVIKNARCYAAHDVTLRGVLAWASSLALCGLCEQRQGI